MIFSKRLLRYLVVTILICVAFVANAQQTPKSFMAGETVKIGYLEYLPPDYQASEKKHPLIIFLHGSGEAGDGSPQELEKVASWGPPSHIKKGHDMCFTVNSKKECFIVISPQQPSDYHGWSFIVAALMDHILHGPDQYKVDTDRIYLTGLSFGGKGTYSYASNLIRNSPNKLAAIAPMSALSEDYDAGCLISKRKIPVWAFHGELDHIVPYGLGLTAFNSVKFCSHPEPTAEMIFTTYPDRYHDAWIPGYDPSHTYHDPNLYEWFLQKTRTPSDEDVTGVEDPVASQFLFYPNPCHDELLFALEELAYLPEEMSLFNSTGDLVLIIKDRPERVDISHLNAGVYVLRYVDSEGKIRSKRVVKI